MNTTKLKEIAKSDIPSLARGLSEGDVQFLVQTLSEKDDMIRYNAFLLLQAHSKEFPNTYSFWENLEQKLESSNSYQRSIGLMLIAENVRWDKNNKFDDITADKYLKCCLDEKFITARQAIQGLSNIVKSTDRHNKKILTYLKQMSLSKYQDNQRKLLEKDRTNIIKILEKSKTP
jgi:hypothetical protein